MAPGSDREGPRLTTARLVLRPLGADDRSSLLRLFREPSVRRYLLDEKIVSARWVRREIASSVRRFRDGSVGLWTLRRIADEDEIIGFAGFREFWDPPVLELTYGLGPRYVGRGLATEAARAVCRFAFDAGLVVLHAAADLPNRRSIRVLDRLGARLERVSDDGPEGTAFYVIDRQPA